MFAFTDMIQCKYKDSFCDVIPEISAKSQACISRALWLIIMINYHLSLLNLLAIAATNAAPFPDPSRASLRSNCNGKRYTEYAILEIRHSNKNSMK